LILDSPWKRGPHNTKSVPATNVFDEHLLISKRPVEWLKVAVLSRCQVNDLCDVVLLGSKL
jgi:hypothetical protein